MDCKETETKDFGEVKRVTEGKTQTEGLGTRVFKELAIEHSVEREESQE